MARLICITGTPGAGKSTLALALCSLFSWKHIDIHSFEQDCGVFNSELDCYDLDMAKVEMRVKEIVDSSKNDGDVFVFDTHVSHLLSYGLVDLCVVVRCADLKVLKERLVAREYSESKVSENLECEIMDVCFDEAQEHLGSNGVVVMEVDGSTSSGYSEEVLNEIKKNF